MSMLFRENKCLLKAACALAFGLTLALTACDGDDKAIVRLGDFGAETPSPATSLPLKVEDLICSEDMQIDGRYLEVINPDGEEYSYSYYKCENGKWISVTEAEVDKAYDSTEEKVVFSKCLGVDCHIKRDFADFRKCNAKNEGLVDSVVDLAAIIKIRFYTCEDNEWVFDDETTCDANLPDFEPDILCDESYEIDGAFYKYSGFYNGDCGDRYYKCENNKWTAVSKGDVGAIVIDPFPKSSRDLIQRLSFKKCNAENEGLVDSVVYVATNPKYERDYTEYYRCEQGAWNEANESVTCDTAGVSLGDVCEIRGSCYKYLGDGAWDDIICLNDILPECDTAGTSVGAICTKFSCRCWSTFMGCLNTTCSNDTYIYMGDGVWENLAYYTDDSDHRHTYSDSPLTQWTKECTAENEGETEKQVYGIDPDVIELYFRCVDGEWTDMSEADYYCTTEKTDIGDTCTVTEGDSTRHYMFMENTWMKSTIDPVLGYCPQARTEQRRYAQKDEKNYYCEEGEWLEASLVPHQYTDPRKEGLTDEEYDVLDLPKEASVGDRAGGLLENCYYNSEKPLGGPEEWRYETYDYCMSKNYYRYRKDDRWTLETEAEAERETNESRWPECTPGSEGVEYSYLPDSQFPGENNKRISVECESETKCYCKDELVEYVFGRSQKK